MSRIYGDDVLEQVAESTRDQLISEKIDEEKATSIAINLAQKMRHDFGGQLVYFPKAFGRAREIRDAGIYAKFDGGNYQALGIEYNLSEMRIRQIIAAKNSLKKKPW